MSAGILRNLGQRNRFEHVLVLHEVLHCSGIPLRYCTGSSGGGCSGFLMLAHVDATLLLMAYLLYARSTGKTSLGRKLNLALEAWGFWRFKGRVIWGLEVCGSWGLGIWGSGGLGVWGSGSRF